MTFWTYTLTSGSLSIVAADGASFISIATDSTAGECTVLGGTTFKGLASTPVSLSTGEGVNFASPNPQFSLDGITITWVAGSVDIVVGF